MVYKNSLFLPRFIWPTPRNDKNTKYDKHPVRRRYTFEENWLSNRWKQIKQNKKE